MAFLREVYILGIVAFYIVFILLYVASVDTLTTYNVNGECTVNSFEQTNIPYSSLVEDDSGMFNNVFKKISCLPDNVEWINYIFLILTTLLIILIAMLLLHG